MSSLCQFSLYLYLFRPSWCCALCCVVVVAEKRGEGKEKLKVWRFTNGLTASHICFAFARSSSATDWPPKYIWPILSNLFVFSWTSYFHSHHANSATREIVNVGLPYLQSLEDRGKPTEHAYALRINTAPKTDCACAYQNLGMPAQAQSVFGAVLMRSA